MVYLDNAATTRVCPEAAEAAVHMMTECFGNPSTTYKLGREAKAAVDKAREIYTSKSSACKKGGRSHVLEAIGLPSNVIDGALRISFSRYTTREDIDALCDALRDAKQTLFPSLH